MREIKDIRDDEIRVIGENKLNLRVRKLWIGIISAIVFLIALGAVLLFIFSSHKREKNTETISISIESEEKTEVMTFPRIGQEVDSTKKGFTEVQDTTINDIPIRIFIPHNAELTLHVGEIDKQDSSIIYTAQAADVRADNGKIVGAFVLEGKPLAWGLSKKGFCASIDGEITIGVADNSPLFEKATEKNGYFFRQYPLVKDGVLIDNEPKGKAIRRAICDRYGEIFMVETLTQESFHDFSQALVDLNIGNAVYLVGSSAYGWAVDETGKRWEFGDENNYMWQKMAKNRSYIVWKKK